MIEKLDPIKHTDNLYDKNGFITNVACGGVVIKKVNELIDAINVLQAQVAILEEHAHPTATTEPAENVQDRMIGCTTLEIPKSYKTDPYAKQRQWIGKLCKFWDIAEDYYYYGPLSKIHDIGPYCYECNHRVCYAHCEPVKPTDSIIYKGDNNE